MQQQNDGTDLEWGIDLGDIDIDLASQLEGLNSIIGQLGGIALYIKLIYIVCYIYVQSIDAKIQCMLLIYCIRGLFGGDFNLAVWQIFIGSPNLNHAVFTCTHKMN